MKDGGVTSLTVTDTARTIQQQAEAMYNNAVKDLSYQKTLYDANGNKVLSAYEGGAKDGNTKDQIIASMVSTISGIKESNPLAFKHTVNINIMETIDISLRSIAPASNLNNFIKALGGYSGNINAIREPQNGCLHVELKCGIYPVMQVVVVLNSNDPWRLEVCDVQSANLDTCVVYLNWDVCPDWYQQAAGRKVDRGG